MIRTIDSLSMRVEMRSAIVACEKHEGVFISAGFFERSKYRSDRFVHLLNCRACTAMASWNRTTVPDDGRRVAPARGAILWSMHMRERHVQNPRSSISSMFFHEVCCLLYVAISESVQSNRLLNDGP